MKLFFPIVIFILASCAFTPFNREKEKSSLPAPPTLFAENSLFRIYSKNILNLPPDVLMMDLFPAGKDFVVGTWSYNNPSPVFFLKNLGDGLFQDETRLLRGLQKAVHLRHAISVDLNNDQVDDFVFADHGRDEPPFPGGLSQVLLSEGSSWRIVHIPGLSDRPLFTYHLSAMSEGGKNYLYQSVFTDLPSGSAPILWETSGNGIFQDKSNLLPPILRQRDYCFMSSKMSDLDNDGTDELLIGVCDTLPKSKTLKSDLIFRFDGQNGFYPLPLATLPPRQKNKSWGTAHFVIDDFDRNGLKDILALPHNHGFSESVLQIHYQVKKFQFVSSKNPLPFHSPPNTFVIWASTGDVNGDGYPDIAFSIKFKYPPKGIEGITHRLLLNRQGKTFEDISDQLPLGKIGLTGIHFLPSEAGGRQPLFALDYLGNYYIVKMKSQGI